MKCYRRDQRDYENKTTIAKMGREYLMKKETIGNEKSWLFCD